MVILGIIVFGLFVGWLAQLILGMGTRPNGQSLAAGLGGSLVGGFLFDLIAGKGPGIQASGFIGSLVGAIIVLAVWGMIDRRSKA
ncbi:MAG TPA: GlsB/YeaQ/YmgE family stress response membrane protein [Microthrixaceae bacterium]|nr:GlsB/YeaQ/YmgE family stress response membrane protein [Microthrixaceae bacterium]